MSLDHGDLAVLLALLVGVAALVAVLPRIAVPYPIPLVLGGLALGFAPGLPNVTLPPDVVLVGVLPPLLYSSAYFTSLRDLRRNLQPIGLLAVGLVVFTTVGVGGSRTPPSASPGSLAAALALPLATDAGDPFPGRALVIFLAFAVILATILVQGLTLPALIRVLDLDPDEVPVREEAKARMLAADAAVARLQELVAEDWVREDTAERMTALYRFRRNRFAARFDDGDDGSIEARSVDYQRLRRELLEAERGAVRELRRIGRIGDQVMRRVERDLDLETARLDAQ